MSFDDFINNFNYLIICHIPDESWNESLLKSEWKYDEDPKKNRAGGWKETLLQNPQVGGPSSFIMFIWLRGPLISHLIFVKTNAIF